MAKVENYRLPFLQKDDVQVGAVGKILGEFAVSGKYEKFTGQVEINGHKYLLSLNNTSVGRIVAKYSDDTLNWVGKNIELSIEDVGQMKSVNVWSPTDKKIKAVTPQEIAWDEK